MRGSLGLLFMALFKKCFGSLLLVGVVMGFFAVWGVGFLDDIKKGFTYVYAFLTPCKGAFEKTTPCKV